MVCTGDILIYGVSMTLSDVVKYILKYLKTKDKNLYDEANEFFKDNEGERYEICEYVDKVLKKDNFLIQMLMPKCCLYSDDPSDDYGKVYLGVELNYNCLVSRFKVNQFKTIDDYEKFYTEGLIDAKKLFEENKNKFNEELGKLLPNSKNKPKFYSLPNDCFSCT
jgi:hypothetical protein